MIGSYCSSPSGHMSHLPSPVSASVVPFSALPSPTSASSLPTPPGAAVSGAAAAVAASSFSTSTAATVGSRSTHRSGAWTVSHSNAQPYTHSSATSSPSHSVHPAFASATSLTSQASSSQRRFVLDHDTDTLVPAGTHAVGRHSAARSLLSHAPSSFSASSHAAISAAGMHVTADMNARPSMRLVIPDSDVDRPIPTVELPSEAPPAASAHRNADSVHTPSGTPSSRLPQRPSARKASGVPRRRSVVSSTASTPQTPHSASSDSLHSRTDRLVDSRLS